MALFQQRPQASDTLSFITFGLQKSVLIVGLGNIGQQYNGTRHNIGFECIDAFVDKTAEMHDWIEKKDFKCHFSSGQIGETKVIAIKPTTFMNLSGEAVQAVAHFYKIGSEQILAIYDDLDVNFGQIRTRIGGGSAGHNGIKSLIQHIGENFGRLRVGIGPKQPEQIDSADFVLGHFNQNQKDQLKNLRQETNAILSEYIHGGKLNPETRSFIF
jgi:peptidyl-tRNA hydrolase, PTH1 family